MTENSKICQLIDANPNWEEVMDKLYPDIKRMKASSLSTDTDYLAKCPYVMFKYGIGARFNDPVVQEARGIIINVETKEVVAWPFRKFGNYDESYADEIDWSTAMVQEKIDGSLIQLWWDEFLNRWSWSTSGTIYAEYAPIDSCEVKNFKELIMRAEGYSTIVDFMNGKIPKLDKDTTYLFELTSPYNIGTVIPYEKTQLYHIGQRNKKTGKESEILLPGIQWPFKYPIIESLEECIEMLSNLEKINNDWDIEGFVVCDANFNRIKVKAGFYKIAKHINDPNNTKTIKRVIKMINEGTLKSEKIPISYKDVLVIVKYYEFRILEFYNNAERMLYNARVIYDNSDGDFSGVHKFLQDNPYSVIVYKGIKTPSDREKTIYDIVKEFDKIENLMMKTFPLHHECMVRKNKRTI